MTAIIVKPNGRCAMIVIKGGWFTNLDYEFVTVSSKWMHETLAYAFPAEMAKSRWLLRKKRIFRFNDDYAASNRTPRLFPRRIFVVLQLFPGRWVEPATRVQLPRLPETLLSGTRGVGNIPA